MTTAVEDRTAIADFVAAGEAARRAESLIAGARELDQQRRELLAGAGFQHNLAEALRERGRCREAFEKARAAEQEAANALDEAASAEATAARQATGARHAAETASGALARAEGSDTEPADLVELDMRAASAARVAGHANSRLADCQSDRTLAKRALDRARVDLDAARANLGTAEINAREENVPRPAVPLQETTLGEMAAHAMQNLVAAGWRPRR